MRRIAILCVLCLLITGAAASGAPLISSWRTDSSANETSATSRLHPREKPAAAHSSGEQSRLHHGTVKRSHGSGGAPVILLGEHALEPTVSDNLVGTVEAFAFRAHRAGTAASISVYLLRRTRATTLFAGLYSGSHGQPRSLLTSGLLRSPKAAAWNSVAVRSARLQSGRTYWLAVLGKGGAIAFRDRGGALCTGERASIRKLRSLPGTWPAGSQSRICRISAYVKGLSSGGTTVFGTNAPTGTTGTTGGTTSSSPTNTAPPTSGTDVTPPPVATAGPTISGSPVVGQTFTTSDGSWSGSPTSYAYEWEDCDSLGVLCTVINGATTSSYILASTDVSSTIRAVVTATNAGGSTPATSAATSAVTAPPAPSNTVLPSISGQAVQGQALTASNGSWTGSPASYAYQWEDCDGSGGSCAGISGATSSSYTLTSSDVGSTIRVVVTATNVGGSTPATSAATSAVTAPPAPSNTVLPSISGQAVQGQALTASNGSWTGSPASYAYQWEDCDTSGGSCAGISGATSSSYTLKAVDVGDTVRVVVTATNVGGSTPATSAATSAVTAPPAPSNTVLPSISGQAVQAQALTASNGSWTGSPASYAYQWEDCDGSGGSCVGISGATSSSYTLTSSDVGSTIRVVVTATNVGGSTPATSAQTAAVTSPPTGQLACNVNATTSNFATQISSATAGQVVCLASGDYSSFTGTSKSAPGITITSAPGAVVTFNSGMRLNLSSVQNFALDGTGGGGTMTIGGEVDMETSGDAPQNKALNLTFQNIAFTAADGNVLLQGEENSNITFNRDTFVDANAKCSGGSATGLSGIFYVQPTASSTTPTGLAIENSVFVAPTDLWNPGRAVQDAAPMAFENNVVTGFLDHTESASCNHIDGLQMYSGTNGSTGGVMFTGNLCYDDYGCIMGFDGTSNNTITDNVCFDMETACINLYSDTGSVVNHNVQQTGGMDPGGCTTMHDTSAPIQGCGNSTLLINGNKSGDRVPSGETYTNNIDHSAPNVESGSLTTNTNNVWSGASSPNINGSATFTGGTNPMTWAGFELTAGSTGHAAGSDGLDVGIRSSAGGPPTGGGSAPANTVAPSLTGTATQGQTLSTTDGAWTITGNVPTVTTYQWFDCPGSTFAAASCTPIQPQTAPTSANGPAYTLQSSDVGDYVFSEVTVTNANGQVNAMSNAVGPVAS